MSLPKIIIVLLPFLVMLTIAGKILIEEGAQKKQLASIMGSSTKSFQERNITRLINERKDDENGLIAKQNANLQMLGVPYKFENLLGVAAILFVIGCIVSAFLFKAGPLLMIYLGGLAGYSIFIYINGEIERRKKLLTIEFLEKMRDIASFMSVGKSLDTAINEACESGNISAVMSRELNTVSREIFTGSSYSRAFMNMYERMQIEEIRMYAETLATFEETGGNVIQVMQVNDRFATQKLEIRNEQNIFVESQKSSQKVIVGVPLAMVVFFFIFNPSFFGNFYSSIIGQIVGIVSISVLILGVKMSNDLAKNI